MKCLKKVSLAKRLPDDVRVSLLNDKVKKKLFEKTVGTAAAVEPLLNRLWPAIEHFPKFKRQEAIKMIRKLDALPTLRINDNLEMVYNGDVAGGTNILQLIRCELFPSRDERVLLPGQDLFYHALLTSPLSSRKSELETTQSPPALKRKRQVSSTLKIRKKLKTNLLHSSARKTLQYSPKRLRSSTRHGPSPAFKERRWQK